MYGSPRGNRPRAMRRNKGPSREYVPGLGKRARGGCRTRAGQGRDGALVGALQRRAAGCKVYPTGTCMCEMAGADAEAAHAPHARDHGRGGRARGAIANGFLGSFGPTFTSDDCDPGQYFTPPWNNS